MKFYIDSKVIRKLISATDEKERESLLKACFKIIAGENDPQLQFIFAWPSLLEYIGFGCLFEAYPKFDDQNKIFSAVINALILDPEKDLVIYLYDQIFAECLRQVQALQEIRPAVLINQIQNKRQYPLFSHIKDPFSLTLESYENLLIENTQNAIHDLTLYLAWDRMCIYLATVFECPSLKTCCAIETLKECLIESFQYITKQGRTIPGFFRFVEALYAYQMRDENLQSYTDSEWLILCQSSIALKSREYLADVCYVDIGIVRDEMPNKFLLKVLTMDSSDEVKTSLALSHYMIGKLKVEVSDWHYSFRSPEIIFV